MSFPAPSPAAIPLADRRAASSWHLAWALAVATGAALMLVTLGAAPPRALVAMALGAAPGVLGFAYAPRKLSHRRWVLLGWTVAAALAMAMTGGVSGPLAIWGLTPVLAAMVYGGLWREGAGLAFAALVALATVQAAGRIGPPPAAPIAFALGLVALGGTLALGAAGLMMLVAGRDVDVAESAPNDAAQALMRAKLEDAESARAYAEADARGKMRFLANMSHELRTPLNAIMGFSDIMRTRLFGDLSPKYTEYAQLIHESGAHLLELISDVLDVSKIEADKYVLSREVFDVREPANAALRILRQQADDVGVQLRGVLPPEPLDVDADRRALKQIVLNLVSNALKFTPPGGSVSVTFAAVAGALDITVADTGVGIAPEDLARLGRPYEQAGEASDRARGTGLGLSLVQSFARLHRGEMSIESRLGEGTAVTVRLPVLAGEALEPPGSRP